MKTIISIITSLLFLTITEGWVFSQNSPTGIENLNAAKKEFLTKQVGITTEEGQQFWPVYNEYLDKKNRLLEEKSKLTVFYKYNSKIMTDNDIDVTMNKYLKIVKAESFLEELFNKRFRKILTPMKVMKIYVAETDFNNTTTSLSKTKVVTMQ